MVGAGAACAGTAPEASPSPVAPDTAVMPDSADTADAADTGEGVDSAGGASGPVEDDARGRKGGSVGESAGDSVAYPVPDFERDAAAALVPRAALPVPLLPGALLPAVRIVAFYGNPASERMGILGELPPDEMLERLDAEVAAWRQADPSTPVRPALQMIAVMATGDPGRDSLFRLRMPDHRIQQVADWAERRDGLLFLDIQPGHSTVANEVPRLERWLARPHVHLALDPEWALPAGVVPGRRIGSMTARDINFAIDFLAGLVDRYHLPPKVLVVHRFTESMIRDADAIRRDPRVQVVINMDGWGPPAMKRMAYEDIVAPEADQFTGFKLFFRNDVRDGSPLLTPTEILELDPAPVYIQYQ
ncbi:MAG: hypothetical protein ACN0LA_13880 [Candidatus Longimicrobiales bacterium M2_2A_002]